MKKFILLFFVLCMLSGCHAADSSSKKITSTVEDIPEVNVSSAAESSSSSMDNNSDSVQSQSEPENDADMISEQITKNEFDAIAVYEDFLNGKIEVKVGDDYFDIDSLYILREGRADSEEVGEYALFDMNGDAIPELHVKTGFDYDIFTYYNQELLIWSSDNSFQCEPKNNRTFLLTIDGAAPPHFSHGYVVPDFWGGTVTAIFFHKGDIDQNGIYDENDDYSFDGVDVSKSEWDALTEKYLSIPSDQIVWKPLFMRDNVL